MSRQRANCYIQMEHDQRAGVLLYQQKEESSIIHYSDGNVCVITWVADVFDSLVGTYYNYIEV